ncbi:MAG: N-acetyltransferase [Oscillospiraceae bacterium]|nr:N-acetyltransferase [Oscillospiraceae bacterium]
MPANFEKERMTMLTEDGIPMGYITFPQVKKNLVNIDHVLTYPKFRGQGNAANMMEALLAHLEQQEKKVILTCSYAQQYMADNPQWQHMMGSVYFEKH